MDHSTSSGDDDRDIVKGTARRHEGTKTDGRQNNRQHNVYYNQRHNSRDYDARSHSSQKSDPNSETTSVKDDTTLYNQQAASSVGSHGNGGGDSSRGFPAIFRHAAISATHLLNGDPAHQFPPSLYQSSTDAPKSDTATVCSGSIMEDIEDVVSHYDGESVQTSNSKQNHLYPPPSSLRRSDSKEGNRLVDFAERSQAVFPKQSKATGISANPLQESSSSSNNDEEARKGMRPPLSRQWLMQHHGMSPFRTGSVKSGGSTAGSDVVVNVGSDCGGSLTDVQSMLSQEDAALLSTVNSETSEATPVTGSVATVAKTDVHDAGANTNVAMGTAPSEEDEKKPHPLLCDESGRKNGGRVSPGGTIYRGRGLRRYQGRHYGLPLKRFHQGGVHLHSDRGPEGNSGGTNSGLNQSSNQQQVQQRCTEDGDNCQWEERRGDNSKDDYRRGSENHNYYSHTSNRDRSRSRSRSRSPPGQDRRR